MTWSELKAAGLEEHGLPYWSRLTRPTPTRSELKAAGPVNMKSMLVTLDTSHAG